VKRFWRGLRWEMRWSFLFAFTYAGEALRLQEPFVSWALGQQKWQEEHQMERWR
jgi:hypothetical protein